MAQRELFHWEVRSFTVLLALDMVERLEREIRHAQNHYADERGGILFGHVIDEDDIEIDDFAFYPSGHRRGVPYDLNLTQRRSIQRQAAVSTGTSKSTSRREALGFFRTHLRPGLFLDQRDFTLMSESFSDCPGIALLIRPDDAGRAQAGIFFWEEGDIERKQSDLIFPLDAEALRARGPIEIEREEPASTSAAARRAEPGMIRKPLLWGVASGLASGALAFAMLAELHVRSTAPPREGTQAPIAEQQTEPEALVAPPAVSDDEDPAADKASADAPADTTRSPFVDQGSQAAPDRTAVRHEAAPQETAVSGKDETVDEAPHPRWVAPAESEEPQPEKQADQPKRTTTAPPVQVASSAAPPPAAAPLILPAPATSVLARAAASPTLSPAPPPVTVDVSVEPKPGGVFKRIEHGVGHVPLLGRLPGFRHGNNGDVVVARPSSGLEPQIPADLRKSLGEEVAVDVQASIDDTGTVTNTEITRGGESQLSVLAEDAVRGASWKPARAGERNVPMDVVVHYRFSPEREP